MLLIVDVYQIVAVVEGIPPIMILLLLLLPTGSLTKRMEIRILLWGKKLQPNPDVLVYQSKLSLQ